jgi:hypothetical protein
MLHGFRGVEINTNRRRFRHKPPTITIGRKA